ncbi:MAG: HAMP domain-containing histidine kinase [Chitinophagaceae bacterium]|nr:HAMP domain-containing histidine kinase [Oligoflexus sp.]
MKTISLSNRLLLATGLIFIVFFITSIGFFYRGQTRLAVQEMDRLLENEALTISTLVNVDHKGKLDFEFSRQFLLHYQSLNFSSFFRFFFAENQTVARESNAAPAIFCDKTQAFRFERSGATNYRVISYRFTPSPEVGDDLPPGVKAPEMCLVIGTEEGPYVELVLKTIYATLPYLLAIFVGSLILLWTMIRTLMRDLNALTGALAASDFSSTRAFPKLPPTDTLEVSAVVEKLHVLHNQAAEVYNDMILFIARAAHQLKTPVSAIHSTLEVLVRRDRTKEELLVGLSDLGLGVKQMSQLTQKLIASTRVAFESQADRVPINLIQFFETLWKVFQYKAEIREITCSVSGDRHTSVLGDEYLLTEIFGNLIENSILYSKPGGLIQISWEAHGETTHIRVGDRGPGISHDVQAHIFKPFIRGDERIIGGSGLGLSIAKSAVNALSGQLELIASSDQGTVMQIILPSFKK